MFLELHVVQSFGPSVINRDDTNTPKSTIFGGVPRARVSSQCLKRLMREHYEAVLGDPARSVTSRVVFERVADTLATLTGRDRAEALTVAAVAFALAGAATGAPIREVLLAFAAGWAENMTQAAMKTIPLGQAAGQRLLAALSAAIPGAAARAARLPLDDMQAFTPMLAILSSQHETQYSRLFRS